MEARLIKTKKGDLPIIAGIYREEFSKPPYNEKWALKKAIAKIKIFMDIYDCYTIFYKNEIIGLVAVNPTFMCPGVVAFGEDIVIKKEFQNKGIGASILKKIFRIYKNRGFRYFMGIAHKKSRALKVYKKKGFVIDRDFVLINKELK